MNFPFDCLCECVPKNVCENSRRFRSQLWNVQHLMKLLCNSLSPKTRKNADRYVTGPPSLLSFQRHRVSLDFSKENSRVSPEMRPSLASCWYFLCKLLKKTKQITASLILPRSAALQPIKQTLRRRFIRHLWTRIDKDCRPPVSRWRLTLQGLKRYQCNLNSEKTFRSSAPPALLKAWGEEMMDRVEISPEGPRALLLWVTMPWPSINLIQLLSSFLRKTKDWKPPRGPVNNSLKSQAYYNTRLIT